MFNTAEWISSLNIGSGWQMVLIILLILVGLVFIIKGGDFFVDAASWMAEKSGIPKFIVGATIVSLCTTLPELLVSAFAAGEGSVDMCTGNAIGSVIANTGLIMGLSLLFLPGVVNRKTFIFKPCLLIFSVLVLWIFMMDKKFYVWEGIILLVILVIFFVENVISAKRQQDKGNIETHKVEETVEKDIEKEKTSSKEIVKNIVMFILGVIGIVVGAQLLVDNCSEFASRVGIPQNVIALTIVAIGTSLPELVTTITAIRKKESSLSVGNVVGANIIDLVLILPVCSIIFGGILPVTTSSLWIDVPICLALTLIAIVPTLITGKLKKWQGASLLGVYGAYLVYLVISSII